MKLMLNIVMAVMAMVVSIPAFSAQSSQSAINRQLEVTATTTSNLVIGGHVKRNYLLVVNKGTGPVLLKFVSAHTGTEGILVPAGGNYEPMRVPMDSLYIRSVSGSQLVSVTEGVESNEY